MVSFPKRYQYHQIETPPPSGQSRHHRLPLVLPYPSTTHRGFFIFPTSHPDSFRSYERALRLPTSFPISGLARLGVRPRLCTRFSRGKTPLMSLPDGERYLRPPQSLVVSLLLSLVSTLVFSRTGGVLSHQSILTHRFP